MAYLQDDPPLPPLDSIFPHLEHDLAYLPEGLDPFTITTTTGFLPLRAPLVDLPQPFAKLSQIVHDMPVTKEDGTPGLLAGYKLCPLIDSGALPDLTSTVKEICTAKTPDMELITALFRDYSFLASSYLLEPCWETWSKDHEAGYGLGRAKLPCCIAGPLMRTAEVLDIPAFMSYAASYALYNYKLVDPKLGPSVYSNLRLIRGFENGLDPRSSEAGFILTHIHMVQETGPLISGAVQLLRAIESPSASVPAAKSAFQTMLSAMTRIEAAMENMWTHSLPKDYISYRTFIFGITSQSMFPNGVIYEGENDNKPLYFRGESGANDSIIPLLDHLCEIPMPANPLTDILVDFRNYRPKPHRTFLAYVMSKAAELGVRQFCIKDQELAQLYLKLLDHVRSFRWRHWLFAREYIIKRTSHPTATGGSPIVTWLPNQLMAVMTLQEEVYRDSGLEKCVVADGDHEDWKFVKGLMQNVKDQHVKLDKEVRKYCEERGV
jgi:indoleamine 2,3-dioxygenase